VANSFTFSFLLEEQILRSNSCGARRNCGASPYGEKGASPPSCGAIPAEQVLLPPEG